MGTPRCAWWERSQAPGAASRGALGTSAWRPLRAALGVLALELRERVVGESRDAPTRRRFLRPTIIAPRRAAVVAPWTSRPAIALGPTILAAALRTAIVTPGSAVPFSLPPIALRSTALAAIVLGPTICPVLAGQTLRCGLIALLRATGLRLDVLRSTIAMWAIRPLPGFTATLRRATPIVATRSTLTLLALTLLTLALLALTLLTLAVVSLALLALALPVRLRRALATPAAIAVPGRALAPVVGFVGIVAVAPRLALLRLPPTTLSRR